MSNTRALWGGFAVCAIALAGFGLFKADIWNAASAPDQAALENVLPEQADESAKDSPDPGVVKKAAQPASSIDTFRLDPEGNLLLAGRAAPGERVTIRLEDQQIATAQADRSGAFVAFGEVESSDRPRVLNLATTGPGGAPVLSDNEVIIAPLTVPERGGAKTGMADAKAPTPERGAMRPSDRSDMPASTPQVALLSDEAGLRPLSTERADSVALDAITYSNAGEVRLFGRGLGGVAHVYLDNRPVAQAAVDAQGQWQGALPDVETGVYTLRVDEVDAQGNVTSRVETPFKREDRAALRAGTDPAAAVTVQPGSTLWAISRSRYGEGVHYVRIFEANKDRIRDPDLIYPGQVFDIPD